MRRRLVRSFVVSCAVLALRWSGPVEAAAGATAGPSVAAPLTVEDATATLLAWLRAAAYYPLDPGCLDTSEAFHANRGYTVTVVARECAPVTEGALLGRWRVDERTREVFVQNGDGRYVVPDPKAKPRLQPADPGACLRHGPVVELRGTLTAEVFAGPPNYESLESGDRKETAWILHLSAPGCVAASPELDLGPILPLVAVQLEAGLDARARWKSAVGRKVVVRGTLDGALTAHHHTSVLLRPTSIEAMPGDRGR